MLRAPAAWERQDFGRARHDPYRRIPGLVYELLVADGPERVRDRIPALLRLVVPFDDVELDEADPEALRAALAGEAELLPRGGPSAGRWLVRLPLVAHRIELGSLTVLRRDGPPFDRDETDALATFAGLAAVALHGAHIRTELRRLAYTDSLTGLGNRRALEDELERVDGMLPLSLLLLDFDGLKAANDVLGYAAGDRLIVESARALAAHVAAGELAARLGGDEFVAVLPGVAEADAPRARRADRGCRRRGAVPTRPGRSLPGRELRRRRRATRRAAGRAAAARRPRHAPPQSGSKGRPRVELAVNARAAAAKRTPSGVFASRIRASASSCAAAADSAPGIRVSANSRLRASWYACRDLEQVLVLNASYEPLNVCSVRRAHVLVWKGKAEVLESLDRPLTAATTTYRLAARDPATGVRPRSPGGQAADLAAGAVRPRRLPLRLLRRLIASAHARPRGAALARRGFRLGERRHRLRAVQPAQR